MKTAISIPDEIFQAAEILAQRLGVSRSELYAKAVFEYTQNHRHENVTAQLNKIYGQENSGLDEGIKDMQLRSIPTEDW
jgi:metal-responsive CopG/Arc/MetJ family transcriptional regulator